MIGVIVLVTWVTWALIQLKATFALMQRPWKQNERPILKINPKHPFQVFPIVILDRRKLDLCDFVGYLGHMGNNSGASVVVAFCSTTSSSSNKRQCMANNQDTLLWYLFLFNRYKCILQASSHAWAWLSYHSSSSFWFHGLCMSANVAFSCSSELALNIVLQQWMHNCCGFFSSIYTYAAYKQPLMHGHG